MNLFEYGLHLGLAFQIQDDLLDVYGNPDTFGKAIGGDILCGKKTFMLLTALSKADEVTRAGLTQTLHDEGMPPKEKIAAVTRMYDRLEVRQDAEQTILLFTEKALFCLTHLPDNNARKHLVELAQSLTQRSN